MHANEEFLLLTGWDHHRLLGKDGNAPMLFWSLIDDGALLQYAQNYADCYSNRNSSAFHLTLRMNRRDAGSILGSMCVTVKRDIFDMPILVIGTFLPNLWAGDVHGDGSADLGIDQLN